VGAEPVLDDAGGAPFQDVDPPAGLGVDEDRRVDPASAQGEVVDAEDAGHLQSREGDREQDAQGRVPGDSDPERRQQPRPRAAR
jgi:hypothetical protein